MAVIIDTVLERKQTWQQRFNMADILCSQNLPWRWSVCQQGCLQDGLQFAECAPSRPRNMRSEQNVAECLLCRLSCVTPQKTHRCDSCWSTWLQLEQLLCCFCCFFESKIFQAAPTVTSATQHPHPHTPTCTVRTLWSQLGIIARGKHHRDEKPFLWSVNNYVAVSESGNRRDLRSLQIMGVRCGFGGTNVNLCVSVVLLKHKSDTVHFLPLNKGSQ